MTAKKNIRLLLLEESQNEAERLVSLFRNAGHATRVQRISTIEDAEKALTQTWDLLILAPDSAVLSPHEVLIRLRHQKIDLPALQRIDPSHPDAATEALLSGAQDAIPLDADTHLLLAAERELNNLNTRRQLLKANEALTEAERRCQLLLDSSMDAIAYIHEGMHIYANRTYCERFGYSDAEELSGIPVIDLIASTDQTQFRDFLRNYSNTGEQTLACHVTQADQQEAPAEVTLSPALYDGEPCAQLVIRSPDNAAELENRIREITSFDPVTGLYNRARFLETLAAWSSQQTAGVGALAYIRLDRLASIVSELGLSDSDVLLKTFADQLQHLLGSHSKLGRLSDDGFVVLSPQLSGDALGQKLKQLQQNIQEHLYDIANRTLQITISVGLAANEQGESGDILLERAHRGVEQSQESNHYFRYNAIEALAAEARSGNIIASLQHALKTDSFQVLFEPSVNLRGQSGGHYEVHLGLNDSENNPLDLKEIQLAAKEARLACTIDRWLILNVLRHLTRNQVHPGTAVTLTLSADSLLDESLSVWLQAAIKAARIPSKCLVLLWHEYEVAQYLLQAQQQFERLRALGVRLGLTQFGEQEQTLNSLSHLRVDFVKLASSQLEDLDTPEAQQRISQLLDNVRKHHTKSVLSGVERANQLTTFWQVGADYIQGRYLQAPSAAMEYNFASEES